MTAMTEGATCRRARRPREISSPLDALAFSPRAITHFGTLPRPQNRASFTPRVSNDFKRGKLT